MRELLPDCNQDNSYDVYGAMGRVAVLRKRDDHRAIVSEFDGIHSWLCAAGIIRANRLDLTQDRTQGSNLISLGIAEFVDLNKENRSAIDSLINVVMAGMDSRQKLARETTGSRGAVESMLSILDDMSVYYPELHQLALNNELFGSAAWLEWSSSLFLTRLARLSGNEVVAWYAYKSMERLKDAYSSNDSTTIKQIAGLADMQLGPAGHTLKTAYRIAKLEGNEFNERDVYQPTKIQLREDFTRILKEYLFEEEPARAMAVWYGAMALSYADRQGVGVAKQELQRQGMDNSYAWRRIIVGLMGLVSDKVHMLTGGYKHYQENANRYSDDVDRVGSLGRREK